MGSYEGSAAMDTPQLHERLNRIYQNVRDVPSVECRRQFELLWDLKELALLERRLSVEVPTYWLEELERFAHGEERKGA